MACYIPGTKEQAEKDSDASKFCDWRYFDGLKDPRGYLDGEYDFRKGYGIMMWHDRYLETARRLAKRFAPVYTFLELGCAKGFLPQAFRMQGIDAMGLDISEYAIEHCHPEMEPYLFLQNASDLSNFPNNKFDLIYSWDFMEHLKPEDVLSCLKENKRIGKRYINHNITVFDRDYGAICSHFPDEPQDPTHVSCYTRLWWEDIFASAFSEKEIQKVEYIGKPFQTGSKRRGMLEVAIKVSD